MKQYVVAFLVCLVILSFAACDKKDVPIGYVTKGKNQFSTEQTESGKKENLGIKNEQEMIADLQAKNYFYSASIDSLEIIKRQTTPEEKIDNVFVKTVSHDDRVKQIKSLQLTYNLYNDGWILDDIAVFSEGENWNEPLAGPDDSSIDGFMGTLSDNTYPHYSSWLSEGCDYDLSAGYAEVQICAKGETVLWDVYDRFTVPLWFDSNSGTWETGPDIDMFDFYTEVDFSRLCGQYSFGEDDSWGNNSAEINILDVDYINSTITIEGWRAHKYYDSYHEDYYENLNGTYTFEMGKYRSRIDVKMNNMTSLLINSDSIYLITGAAQHCLFQTDS